jgi:hypothetical protein
MARDKDEQATVLAQTGENREPQHHRAKTTRIAALAHKRHALIVLELQA